MDDLFGDVLPREVTQRTTKAEFTEAFFGPYSRDFAERWTGAGLDTALIDPERLRDIWLGPEFDARSGSALQGAWTALYWTNPRSVDNPAPILRKHVGTLPDDLVPTESQPLQSS